MVSRPPKRQQSTLQEYFEEYILECRYSRRLREATLRGYRETLRNFSVIMPEVIYPDMLSVKILNLFFERLHNRKRTVGRNAYQTGIRASTVKTYWHKLNAFFEWLRIRKVIKSNPLATIQPPDVTYDDKRALQRNEIHQIISAITLHQIDPFLKKRDLLMVSLLLFCGLRKTELLSLHINDVDMGKRVLTVRGHISKSKRTRQIPIHPMLYVHLQEYLKERRKGKLLTPYLIVSHRQNRGLSTHGMKHWVARLKTISGVAFHLHQFRHSFACNLAQQNVNAIKIQKLMGHADLRMTEQYVRSLTVDDFREDINQMSIDSLSP